MILYYITRPPSPNCSTVLTISIYNVYGYCIRLEMVSDNSRFDLRCNLFPCHSWLSYVVASRQCSDRHHTGSGPGQPPASPHHSSTKPGASWPRRQMSRAADNRIRHPKKTLNRILTSKTRIQIHPIRKKSDPYPSLE